MNPHPSRRAIAIRQAVAVFICLFAAACVVAHITGCAGTATRAEAQGALLVTTRAVRLSDEVCGEYAIEHDDLALARACSTAYDVARGSLILAANGVDAWDESKRKYVICNLADAAKELSRMADALRARKYQVPVIVDDALKLAAALGGCHV